MERTPYKTPVIVALVVLSLVLCGCNEELRLHPIYHEAITGAVIGGIIGYQSREEGEGAAIGAAIFGIGELLEQLDKGTCSKEEEHMDEDTDGWKEVFVIMLPWILFPIDRVILNSFGLISFVVIEVKDTSITTLSLHCKVCLARNIVL